MNRHGHADRIVAIVKRRPMTAEQMYATTGLFNVFPTGRTSRSGLLNMTYAGMIRDVAGCFSILERRPERA